MNDGQRIYPVDKFIIHHSMGPRFANASDIEVQDWHNSVGRNRGYAGVDHSYHEHPSRPGVETFAQAQFAGIPDSSNKYNYRIVTLIARPFENVAWHAGNWFVNQTSIGIENCGDFTGMLLEDRQLMCIADFYRPVDQELNGQTSVWGHQEVSGASTACPARIMEQRDKLVEMINDPVKWNNIIWPVVPPKPTPVITTKTETVNIVVPFEKKILEDVMSSETKVTTIGVNGNVKTTYTITLSDGVEVSRDIYSEVVTDAIDEVTTIGTYKPPVYEENEQKMFIAWLIDIIDFIAEKINWRKK